MVCKLIITLAIATLANAAIVPVAPAVPIVPAKIEEYDPAPQYSFAYDVQDTLTGDSKAQYETRNGDIVQGSYSFIEADGTRRIVDYTADPINGFNAIVSREPALAAISTAPAAPLAPIAPVGIAPGVPVAPAAAPLPAIPATGPDSDVEVLDARSGPIRETPARRFNGYSGDRIAPLNRQSPVATVERREKLRGAPIRAIASRLAAAPVASSQAIASDDTASARYAAPVPASAPVPAPAPAAEVAPVNLAYSPYAAYTAAYSSPLAFSAPVSGLTYTSVKL